MQQNKEVSNKSQSNKTTNQCQQRHATFAKRNKNLHVEIMLWFPFWSDVSDFFFAIFCSYVTHIEHCELLYGGIIQKSRRTKTRKKKTTRNVNVQARILQLQYLMKLFSFGFKQDSKHAFIFVPRPQLNLIILLVIIIKITKPCL